MVCAFFLECQFSVCDAIQIQQLAMKRDELVEHAYEFVRESLIPVNALLTKIQIILKTLIWCLVTDPTYLALIGP